MYKILALVGVLFSISSVGFAQDYWQQIINNNRSEGLTKVENTFKTYPTIENLISREIIRNENGQLATSPDFIQKFISQTDYPNYLYALWNESFIFSNYISSGITKAIKENINTFYGRPYSDITLASSLSYVKGVSDRNYKDFNSYRAKNAEVSVIRDWQYCGVFENMNKSGLDVIYDPESHPENDIVFEANSNGKVNWYTPKGIDPTEAFLTFDGHTEYGTGVHYAQTFVNNPTERKVVLRLGNSGKIKAWINDVVVFESILNGDSDFDAHNIVLTLPKGKSRLLIKVASEASSSYFSARFTDDKGALFNDITYSSVYSPYEISTAEQLNAQYIKTSFETYFEDKVKSDPNNFLYKYCLVRTYLRNEKYDDAKDVILPLYEANPKSSILRRLMIEIYYLEENYTTMNEIKENLQKDDEDYHLSMEYKFQDTQELFRMSMSDMETFLNKYSDMVNDDLILNTVKIVSSLRKEDKAATRRYLDKLIALANSRESVNLIKVYAPIYSNVFNDTKSHLKILTAIDKKYFDYGVRSQLSDYYDDINKSSKAYAMIQDNAKNMQNDFSSTSDIISYLHKHERYKESLPYIDRLLEIYPYSFVAMEMKGDALIQTNKEAEGLKLYDKSLVYNSGHNDLRRKIEDISDKKDLLEEYAEKDIYKYIADNKGKELNNNYGFNILKNDAITELYTEAGGRGRYTWAYEITSEKGVERFKEYNLGLRGNYNIIKSEIVKKDGSIVPADANRSSFVFTGLSIGDVVLIDYQKGFSGYGRFYKDYVDYYTFDVFHPIVNKKYIMIAPKDKKFDYLVTKEGVDFSKEEKDGNIIYKWEINNNPGCAHSEDYMPELDDFAAVLHISTIKNWNEIANWYSDLVRSQMIIDNDVKREFKVIFPDENYKTLSEDERAKRIYYYMMNNFNYSSVNFRQSGYIPQKPGKTLITKLGDCKDFSTVFVTFAKMAGLEANLVLTLTSDNGRKAMILPSQDFNHCIARVMIDGKEQFLELTDKNLPYKALPNTDREAAILVIPHQSDANGKADLRKLSEPNRIENSVSKDVEMRVTSSVQKFNVKATLKGDNRSYWASVFESPTYENYKKTMTEYFQKRFSDNLIIDTVFATELKKDADVMTYEAKMTLTENVNKIGNFKILKIPHVNFEYTGSIISEAERKHTIEYLQYEETDVYRINYMIYLDEPGEFVEIPKNKSFTYKGHSYERKYTLVNPKQLKIEVVAKPTVENVTPEEYKEFKAYVKSVIEAKDEFVGFK